MSEISAEIGSTVEAVVGLVIDRTQDLAAFALQQAASQRGMLQRGAVRFGPAALAMGRVSLMVPAVAGRVVTSSSLLAMRTGLLMLRTLRKAAGALS